MFNIKEKGGKEIHNPDKVMVHMDNARFVPKHDIDKLIELPFANITIVHSNKNPVPFDNSIELIDLKLDVMGPKEDEYYGALPYLVKNIRRGNTLIKYQDKSSGKVCYTLGRKGLMKFFDMRMSFI